MTFFRRWRVSSHSRQENLLNRKSYGPWCATNVASSLGNVPRHDMPHRSCGISMRD